MVLYHQEITVALVGGVALITLALSILAFRARRRTGNRRLGFVAAAFALFFLKSFITAAALVVDPATMSNPLILGHGHLEFLGSAFDLVIVALLAAPLLVSK